MDYRRPLISAFLAASAGVATAGYAQLANPSGFSGGGGVPFTFAASSNDQVFGRVIHQPNGLTTSVSGQRVTMPASYRLAANAPRIAAAVIFLNPGIRTAVGIASWLGVAGFVWDQVNRRWTVPDESSSQSDGREYKILNAENGWFPTASNACTDYVSRANSDPPTTYSKTEVSFVSVIFNSSGIATGCEINLKNYSRGGVNLPWELSSSRNSVQPLSNRGGLCPAGWYNTPAGCVQGQPMREVGEDEFKRILSPDNQPGWPMPDSVPKELPPNTPLPVEQPVINPAPGSNPAPRPLFIPTGNPVPNPNYDPNAAPGPNNQPWFQPGVRLVPSPTADSPWRVDMQPVDRPTESANPMPGPEVEDSGNPNDKPKEEKSDLCKDHPDIVACQKLGDLSPENLPKNNVTFQLEKSNGFGPDNGSCPAPKEFIVLGKQMAFRWDLLCNFADGIRPLLIGFAYLSAAFAFLGLSRKGA